jgi:hypothetical protein
MTQKNAVSRCLVGLALVALAADSAAAGRAALVGSAADQDGRRCRTLARCMAPDPNVALDRRRDEVMRMAADRHEVFVYSSPSGLTVALVPADPTDAASARRLSMEVEMKTGHRKYNKKDTQLDSPAGARPAVMYPKKDDEDVQNVEPKPAKVHRPPTPPKRGTESR